jgi:two-component system chemotaxis sensor kinase CheA
MMDEGRQVFSAESAELLEEMESGLLTLEGAPNDQEAINAVFRAVHTIKGSAGIVGLDAVEGFAHTVENVLDSVREGTLAVQEELVALLLQSRDHLATLIPVLIRDEEPSAELRAREGFLMGDLAQYLGRRDEGASPKGTAGEESASAEEAVPEGPRVASDTWHISLRFGRDVMRGGMDPLSFLSYLPKLGEIVSLTTVTEHIPPPEAMDPESCYLGFEIDFRSEYDKQSIEDVFEFVREDCSIHILPPGSAIGSYVNLIGDLPEDSLKLGEILTRGGALTEGELREALRLQEAAPAQGKEARLGDILVHEGMVHPAVLDAALQKQKESAVASAPKAERRTIRVDTEKLDQMINMVGELVISGANISQHGRRLRDKALQQSVHTMTRLIEEIRERAMRVRMVPLHETLNRFKRVVHDLAHGMGKEIHLATAGGETEMDRNVIEKIKDPLMHIVRNAADHGIELPARREEEGKPRRGTIALRAYQETSDIVIEVADDGRGLDREALLGKALDLGLAHEGVTYTDREVHAFLFAPGFSTATEVTNISGRGVGMDVVRRNVEGLRGAVEIQSTMGAGTTVRVRLPLTLAIIEGFLVSIGESHFVVPMDMMVECIELTEEARKAAHGRHHIGVRGEILPYVRLDDLFGIRSGVAAGGREHIVVVRYAGQVTGLVVDRLYGEVQAVIKDLGRFYRHVRGLGGATILGDGTVALILDVKTLVNLAIEREGGEGGAPAPTAHGG